MRIGILTQPLSRNYGGILQNYALQQALIKLGHVPYTFDLGKYTWQSWIVTTIKSVVKKMIGRPYTFIDTPIRRRKQESYLRMFVDKHINLITPRCSLPTIGQVEKYRFDALIVGSDQVWRPRYNRSIEDMYLGFTSGMAIKRIAYAASFGTEEWEYTAEQTAICKMLAQQFDAISVRESSGVQLCRDYLGVNAMHVLDPTLLLSATEYGSIIEHIPAESSPYLFAYILDANQQKIDYVTKMASQRGLEVIVKGAGDEITSDDSIEGWLANFRDAEYIVTDSFHGSVFSIIFNKEFNVILNTERGADRMNSLLSMLCLGERLVYPHQLCDTEQPKTSIDWQYVNSRVAELKSVAIDFLSEHLC